MLALTRHVDWRRAGVGAIARCADGADPLTAAMGNEMVTTLKCAESSESFEEKQVCLWLGACVQYCMKCSGVLLSDGSGCRLSQGATGRMGEHGETKRTLGLKAE